MTRQELLCRIVELMIKDMAVIKLKNNDYADEKDALRNLKEHGLLGMSCRIGDKYHRLNNFIGGKKYLVKNESFIDTVGDLRRYCYLLQVLFEEENLSRGNK